MFNHRRCNVHSLSTKFKYANTEYRFKDFKQIQLNVIYLYDPSREEWVILYLFITKWRLTWADDNLITPCQRSTFSAGILSHFHEVQSKFFILVYLIKITLSLFTSDDNVRIIVPSFCVLYKRSVLFFFIF